MKWVELFMASPSAPPLPIPPADEPQPLVRERWWVHVGLFVVTFASVTLFGGVGPGLRESLTFATCLLAILLTHELGHYFAGRFYGVSISPPYFIPVPIGIGTLGAVIQIRTPIPTRTALVDIGAAGPIAGMCVALPMLVVGIAQSHYAAVPYVPGLHLPGYQSLWTLGRTLVEGWLSGAGGWHALKAVLPPAHASDWSGDSVLSLALQHLILGRPPPGTDLLPSPLFSAAWYGMLVTLLNLLPIGQLDGGHVAHALLGRRGAVLLGHLLHVVMIGLMIFASFSWIVWLLLTRYLVGVEHPPVTYPQAPLARSRYAVAAVALLLLVLTFLPVPLEVRPLP